jgi:hypothetical protein
VVGRLFGSIARCFGGRGDDAISRVVDVLMAFPGILLDSARSHLFDALHLTIFPGLAIALLVLGYRTASRRSSWRAGRLNGSFSSARATVARAPSASPTSTCASAIFTSCGASRLLIDAAR